ncbi:hypothetical protein [Streptomyces sp. NPDC058583]|uniref:hypothetical protein n=1 Tax=unclassified Streptomyces TaxID=2593676 RepID=UPI0036614CB3
MHGGDGVDAQRVALAAPHDHPLVERGALCGLQVGGAEEAGDLARHVEGDRQFRGGGVLLDGGSVVGQEVGDGRGDGAAADPVVAGEGGDGAALEVRGAHVGGLADREGGPASSLAALGLGGAQAVVGPLSLEVGWSSSAARVCTMTFTVDSNSPVRGRRAVRSIAENALSWMRSAT